LALGHIKIRGKTGKTVKTVNTVIAIITVKPVLGE